MDNDFRLVRRCLIPADAFILCGCLRAAGLNATVMDGQHVQADLLLAHAIGGARVMVPASEMKEALEILGAFERGELALDDDDDVGEGAHIYEFTPRK
jgi:hypothetical protein